MSFLQNMCVVQMEPFRAVSSGSCSFAKIFGPGGFEEWIQAHSSIVQRQLWARPNFLWHDGPRETWGRGLNTQIYAVRDDVTQSDVAPYPLITFPGGLFLVATANEADESDLQETVAQMFAWIERSPVFSYGDFPASGMCNMPGRCADALLGIAQQMIFLPLKKKGA